MTPTPGIPNCEICAGGKILLIDDKRYTQLISYTLNVLKEDWPQYLVRCWECAGSPLDK